MKRTTYHDGANAERKAIRGKLKRVRRSCEYVAAEILDHLIEWINQRDERYNKRKGGL